MGVSRLRSQVISGSLPRAVLHSIACGSGSMRNGTCLDSRPYSLLVSSIAIDGSVARRSLCSDATAPGVKASRFSSTRSRTQCCGAQPAVGIPRLLGYAIGVNTHRAQQAHQPRQLFSCECKRNATPDGQWDEGAAKGQTRRPPDVASRLKRPSLVAFSTLCAKTKLVQRGKDWG